MGAQEAGGHVKNRVEGALGERAELARDVVPAGDVTADQRHAQLISGALRDVEADLGDALLGDQAQDAARVGRDLLQDLEALSGERARVHGHSREIVAGRGVVRNQPGAYGIADPGEHDRDRRRRGPGRHGVGGTDGDQDVGLGGDQRLGLRLHVGSGPLRVLDEQRQVHVLAVAELTESLTESRQDLAEAESRRQDRDLDGSSGRGRVERGDEEHRERADAGERRPPCLWPHFSLPENRLYTCKSRATGNGEPAATEKTDFPR